MYQQCLQCGYIHDLQTFSWVDKKQVKQKEKKRASHYVTAKGSDDEPRNTPRLTKYAQVEYLTFPPELQAILNNLLKERQNNHQKSGQPNTAL